MNSTRPATGFDANPERELSRSFSTGAAVHDPDVPVMHVLTRVLSQTREIALPEVSRVPGERPGLVGGVSAEKEPPMNRPWHVLSVGARRRDLACDEPG